MLKQRIRRLEMLVSRHRHDDACRGQPLLACLRRADDRAKRAAPDKHQIDDPTHEDWFDLFEAWGREGRFDRELDFPIALAFYGDALRRAKEQTDPPFDPPEDFLPRMKDMPTLRLLNWRSKASFPQVHEGWKWLMGMLLRLQRSIPAVTEAEFANLAAWFHANFDRLIELSRPTYLLVLDQGRKETVSNLREELRKGPRAVHAGEVAEDVRWLQKRFSAREGNSEEPTEERS